MGITYFKLKSDYSGDCTKNCGLTGEEIDRNNHFLRGYDIEEVQIDNATGVLTFKRVNGEEMHVKAGETIGEFKIDFDPITGTLTYTTFNGKEYKVEGFLSEYSSVKISTDHSIDGNGTITDPLRISAFGKTGQYAPAQKFIDCVNGETLPKGETVGKGYRVITRENIDKTGKLYNLEGVRKIMEDLELTEWRVPSKADWDKMLNSIELCDKDKNHDLNLSNAYLGENAGAFLKSLNIWNEYPVKEDEYSVAGEDKFNFQVLPLGYGTNRPTAIEGEDCDAEGLRKISAFWTSTKATDIDDMFVKEFSYRSRKVRQYTKEPDAYLSLRLVKDYMGDNYETVECINGQTIPCVLMKDSLQIWTQINVGFNHEQYGGVSSIEWDDLTAEEKGVKIKYFVNEWEGNKWVRGEMGEGDTIVLFNHKDQKYHEWKLIDGILIDVVEQLKNEFNKEFVRINDEINNLHNVDGELQQQITNNAIEINQLKKRTLNLEERADIIDININNFEERLQVIEGEADVEGSIKHALENAIEHADIADANLQKQIDQNKLVEDNTHSLVITPNNNGNGTVIRVNIPDIHGNIKVDNSGLYFDGYMGTF